MENSNINGQNDKAKGRATYWGQRLGHHEYIFIVIDLGRRPKGSAGIIGCFRKRTYYARLFIERDILVPLLWESFFQELGLQPVPGKSVNRDCLLGQATWVGWSRADPVQEACSGPRAWQVVSVAKPAR